MVLPGRIADYALIESGEVRNLCVSRVSGPSTLLTDRVALINQPV